MSQHLKILLGKLETVASGVERHSRRDGDKYPQDAGVSTLGVKLPEPDKNGMFHKDQFKLRDLEKARDAVNKQNASTDQIDLITLYERFRTQKDTIAKKREQTERDRDIYETIEKRRKKELQQEREEYESRERAQVLEKQKRENAHVRAARPDFHERWDDLVRREREAEHDATKPHRFPWE